MNRSLLRCTGTWVCSVALVLHPPSLPARQQRKATKSTLEMWSILRERMDAVDPEELKFLKNDQIAERLRGRLTEAKTPEAAALRERLAKELLLAGKTEEAIELFDQLLQPAAPAVSLTPARRLHLQKLLAVSWLRLGEQRNCLLNHTSRSCILPIKGPGLYKDRDATLKAKKLFLEVLGASPMDYTMRWLLNVAAMTLGEYPDGIPSEFRVPLPQPRDPGPFPVFTDVAASLGLDLNEYAGGSCLEDFDNDGDIDVFMDSEGFSHPCHYFENAGDGKFIDRTNESGLWGEVGGRVTATADYNNDGFVDIYVCRGAWMTTEQHHLPNTLLRNNGDGTFDNVTIEAGLLCYHPTSHAAWGDYDNDGHVDLFVCNEVKSAKSPPHACQLYRNQGDGTFNECAVENGVDVLGFIKSASWGDYNKDGFLDLYLSNLDGPNHLFLSSGVTRKEGEKWFADVAEQTRTAKPDAGFPSFFFDYDNDGWLDIFASAFANPEQAVGEVAKGYLDYPVNEAFLPRLYHNNRDGSFTEVAESMGLKSAIVAMSASYGDLDNDGFADIYCGTGFLDPQFLIPNVMLRNIEGRAFDEVTVPSGLGHLQKGHGLSFGDLDNDGDLDILSVMGGGFSGDRFYRALFLNPGNKNSWVNLRLSGTKCNRAALNSRIDITITTPKGQRHVHVMIANQGSFASSPMQKLIGLGNATTIESVEVFWQGSNVTQRYAGLELGKAYEITEGEPNAKLRKYAPIKIEAKDGPEHHHHQ